MKIALSTVEGVSVLTGAGEISSHDLDVLRAGLTKLLKSGRNRIILEFPQAEMLPDNILRELTQFDVLARELSGRIVLTGSGEKFCKRILQFALPPVIESFEDMDLALKYFREKDSPKPVLFEPDAEKAAAEAKLKMKANFRQKELTEATDLRKRISELENENQALLTQLQATWLASHAPPTPLALQGEIDYLKQRLEEILEQAKASKTP